MRGFPKFRNSAKRVFKKQGMYRFEQAEGLYLISDGTCVIDCSDLDEAEKSNLHVELREADEHNKAMDMQDRFKEWVANSTIKYTPTRLHLDDLERERRFDVLVPAEDASGAVLFINGAYMGLLDLRAAGKPLDLFGSGTERGPLCVKQGEKPLGVIAPVIYSDKASASVTQELHRVLAELEPTEEAS